MGPFVGNLLAGDLELVTVAGGAPQGHLVNVLLRAGPLSNLRGQELAGLPAA